jgi:hypothetical protein
MKFKILLKPAQFLFLIYIGCAIRKYLDCVTTIRRLDGRNCLPGMEMETLEILFYLLFILWSPGQCSRFSPLWSRIHIVARIHTVLSYCSTCDLFYVHLDSLPGSPCSEPESIVARIRTAHAYCSTCDLFYGHLDCVPGSPRSEPKSIVARIRTALPKIPDLGRIIQSDITQYDPGPTMKGCKFALGAESTLNVVFAFEGSSS